MLFRKLFGRNNQQDEDSVSSSYADVSDNTNVPQDELAVAEKEHKDVLAEMDRISAEIMSNMPMLLRRCYKQTAEETVTGWPSNTEKLGAKLSKLKNELADLDRNTVELVEEKLNCDKWWWHRLEDNGRGIYFNEELDILRLESLFSIPLRGLVDEVTSLLERYGYTTFHVAPMHYDSSGEMRNLMKSYDLALEKEREFRDRISEVKEKGEKERAENLWRDA